jgi:hypothetical protein
VGLSFLPPIVLPITTSRTQRTSISATADSDSLWPKHCKDRHRHSHQPFAKASSRQDWAEAGGRPLYPKISGSSGFSWFQNLTAFHRAVLLVWVTHSTMSIRINATVNEARAAAGHKTEQWASFYVSCRASHRFKRGADERST